MSLWMFNPNAPDLGRIRQAIFQRLRTESDPNQGWNQLNDSSDAFLRYLDIPTGNERYTAAQSLTMAVIDVFWQLISEGILAPGFNSSNTKLPFFHVTAYGRRVLSEGEYQPHDRDGYLARLVQRNPKVDPTVLAYLTESLETFSRGSRIASMVMLGVAAERVFDLLCQAMLEALKSAKERTALEGHIARARIKPRIEFVQHKFDVIGQTDGLPESAPLMITALYELIRIQRNDLGHPREVPPRLEPDVALARLHMFGAYYETAEEVRRFLASHQV